MSISGFVINNINQQSVRHQLRQSTILIASMVSDEMDFLIRTNETTLAQIVDTLEYIPAENQKRAFIKDVAKKYPHCKKIKIVKSQTEVDKIKGSVVPEEESALYAKMKNGSYLVAVLNIKDFEKQLFESVSEDNRQIYILDSKNRLLASHNFTPEVYEQTMKMLHNADIKDLNIPILFGEEKNEPIVYLKSKDFNYTVIVRTTSSIAKRAIIDNRIKIILSVLVAILSTMVVIGFYIFKFSLC